MHICICKGWNEKARSFHMLLKRNWGEILWLNYSMEYFALDCSILERAYYYTTFRSVEQTATGGCGVSHS